ncbi:MAG: hypothetical protein ABH811_00720 [archaeon]
MSKCKKRNNRNGKIIASARNYLEIPTKPYISLAYKNGVYVPDGACKSFNDLKPFIDRSSFEGITPLARKNLIREIMPRPLYNKIKKLEVIDI